MELAAGNRVAERYRLDSLIGEGGMGVVWAATDTTTDSAVAIKFLRGGLVEESHRRFLREARAAQAVRHDNVVAVVELLELDDGAPAMVMELLRGESLGQLLARQGRLSPREAAELLVPAVAAVEAAHAVGVVHRDLKPENIYLSRSDQGPPQVKVLDFGIAKLTPLEGDGDATAITVTGALVGTPCYMAPEQAAGESNVDHRADVWALGIILYQALTGVLPTRGDNLGQIWKRILTPGAIPPAGKAAPDLPLDLQRLLDAMLTAERDGRPDLATVRRVLSTHLPGAEAHTAILIPERSATPSAPQHSTDPYSATVAAPESTGSRAAQGLAAAAVAALVAGAAWWGLGAGRSEPSPPPVALAPSTAPSAAAPPLPSATATPAPLPAPTQAASAPTAPAPTSQRPAAGPRRSAAAPPSAAAGPPPAPSPAPKPASLTGDVVQTPPF